MIWLVGGKIVMTLKYHPTAILSKIMAMLFILACVIVVSGCSSTIPSLGSSKPKYAYLDISTAPAKAITAFPLALP
jgi:hypothetical protein